MDLVNSFSFGAGANDLPYYKLFRTIDNGSYYNVLLNKDYAFLLTSNFILNNHKRNQVNGSITCSFPQFTVNYFNDGGAPFYLIPIADNLDRYWTGGLSVFVHNKSNYKSAYNSVEASFDQFTGYSPLLFEASSMLGIYMPNYNLQYEEGTNEPKPANYNTSMYDLKIFPMKGYGIDIGAMGALKDLSYRKKKEYYFGLQDIIHVKGGFSLHPNNDNQHFSLGGYTITPAMSVCKQILFLIVVAFVCGCSPRNIAFSTNNFTNGSFYQAIPLIVDKNLRIDSVILYETTFEEKPYEGYYVIDYSEVNAQNDKNILHYKPFKGFYQKLYLLKLVTEPKDSVILYFSLKYNSFDQCVGFGPSYLGRIDEQKKMLLFYNELYIRSKKGMFSLRKSKLPLVLYMSADGLVPKDYINIEKMIVEKSFEIGNNVVIDIHRVFRDSFALKFEYLATQKIN